MTTIWEFTADQLLTHLGENGEHWVKGHYSDTQGFMCLHGAIRMCDLQPGDTYVIEQVAESQGWGPTWNDDRNTSWEDIQCLVNGGIVVTDQMLAETFGPNWEHVVNYVRNLAAMTKDQVNMAIRLDEANTYEEWEDHLEYWVDEGRYRECRVRGLPLFDWFHPAFEAARDAASYRMLRAGNRVLDDFARVAEILVCRHWMLADGYEGLYAGLTKRARDLFGPLHPDDPS